MNEYIHWRRWKRSRWLIAGTVGLAIYGFALVGFWKWVHQSLLPEWSDRTEQHIVVIAEDLCNGGILGVVMGVREASQALNWSLDVFDLDNSEAKRKHILDRALDLKPDGLVLVGGDVVSLPEYDKLKAFQRRGIPIVGWHVAPYPGPVEGTPVRVNVTTDSRTVAIAAAAMVKPPENGKAGVVIFTDSRINIAMEKANRMVEALKACDRCEVLSVEDIPLNRTATLVPPAIRRLQKRYGDRWTHSLAINDLYFDHAIRELVVSNLPPPLNISAGDGSPSALLRLQHNSFQYASVAEPLLMHGWQLVDELYRLLGDRDPSGYVNPPYAIVHKDAARAIDAEGFFDPERPYRETYLKAWQGGDNG